MVYQIDSGADGTRREMTYLSPAVERLHGLTVENVLKDPALIYMQVLEEDREALAEAEAHAFETRTKMDQQVRVRLPSGEVRWRHFVSVPRKLDNGHVVWDGIELDVTEGR